VWRFFPLFEKIGLHVLPVHYYSPIPDTKMLRNQMGMFEEPLGMYGVELNEDVQKKTLEKVVARYEDEYVNIGGQQFGTREELMRSFAPINALTLYSFIRNFKPHRMIEVGAGMSTKISSAAFVKNRDEGVPGNFATIEPYPSKDLLKGYDGLNRIIKKKVQEVSLNEFKALKENDILFIDSSHTVKIFGDVNYLYLNIIPQLNAGVIIHIHDIFFPFDYLPHHFFNKGTKQIWQEQYLLQAFLMFNKDFEILLSLSYMHYKYLNNLKSLFPWYQERRWPSSFWMSRKGASADIQKNKQEGKEIHASSPN
jgi:hypothetical protein